MAFGYSSTLTLHAAWFAGRRSSFQLFKAEQDSSFHCPGFRLDSVVYSYLRSQNFPALLRIILLSTEYISTEADLSNLFSSPTIVSMEGVVSIPAFLELNHAEIFINGFASLLLDITSYLYTCIKIYVSLVHRAAS